MDKNTALQKVEETRAEMIARVNKVMDLLVARINNGESLTGADVNFSSHEMMYPLGISPAMFKGKKPTAVHFGEEKVAVKTWRQVHTLILRRCAATPKMTERLMDLRGKIIGRSRCFLSDTPEGMDAPVKISDGLYAESYFDTEFLIKVMTVHIFQPVRFDYANIYISVVTPKIYASAKERKNEYSHAYRAANRERINAYQREWHAKRRK